MKNLIRKSLMMVLLVFSMAVAYGQAVGDYRSVSSGDWATLATWQRWNGSQWLPPTPAEGYPGQYTTPATGAVTIQAGNNILVSNSNTINYPSTGSLGSVIINGILSIDIGINTIFNTTLFVVTPGSGLIDFVRQKGSITILPTTATFIVSTGGITGQSANTTITAGGVTYQNSGTPNIRFTYLMNQGGVNVINFVISNPYSPSCNPTSFNIKATANPSIGAVLNWYDVPTGGTSLIGAVSSPSTYTTPTLYSTPTPSHTYYVTASYTSPVVYTTPRIPVTVMVNSGFPGNPGPISGLSTQCKNITGATYSVPADPNVSDYVWTVPTANGWSIIAGATTNIISVATANNASGGTISVYAHNACGNSSSPSSISVSIGTASAPTLSAVTQPNCTTATGSFTITNYDAGYIYSATPAAGVSIAGNTVSAPAGTYTITATLGNCSATSSARTVNSQPSVPIQYSVTGGGAYCSGGTGVAVGLSNSQSGVSYQLLIGGVNSGSALAGNGYLISFGNQTTAGIYSVRATNTTSNCTQLMSGSVTVTANPVATPSVSLAASPGTTICAATSVTFTATASNTGGGTITYNFKIGGVSQQNGASNTYTNAALANGNAVTCDISITGGTCLTSSTATSNTVTISLYGTLTPGSHNTTPLTECLGYHPAVLIFTTAPSGGGTPYSYQWRINGINYPGATTGTFDPPVPTATGTYSYDCIVTDICWQTFTTTPKVYTIVDDPSVTISGSNSVCINDLVTLTANVSGGAGTITYQWASGIASSGPWTDIAGATNVTYNPSTSVAGTYYYQVTVDASGVGCNNADPANYTVTVNPKPTCSISGDASVYAGSTNTYTSTVNPADGVSHSWSVVPAGLISGSYTGSSVTVVAGAAGTSFTLTDNISRLSCTSSCSINVSVGSLPCSITPSAAVANGETTTYTGPAGMATYQWEVTGNYVSATAINQPTITVVAGNSCQSYSIGLMITSSTGGSSFCTENITVTDNQPPTFTPPSLAAGYCVEPITEAVYKHDPIVPDLPTDDDLTTLRPDYYKVIAGSLLLDIDLTNYPDPILGNIKDNCSLPPTPNIRWEINYGNDATVEFSGTGQISATNTEYHFPTGKNKITYWVKDAANNESDPQIIYLNVIARPVITKNF